jgi:alkylated DNA repair dioxygenase AlkB
VSTKIERDSLDLEYWPEFLSSSDATELLQSLLATTPWEQLSIAMYGKRLNMPRLTCWYGDASSVYTYSGIRNEPRPWTPRLLAVKEKIEGTLSAQFNSVLLNLYRDGRDSMSWHSDDEPELGPTPTIASLSLGVVRRFDFRPIRSPQNPAGKGCSLELEHGSLLLMKGETQRAWQHGIAKSPAMDGVRVNLTFRRILPICEARARRAVRPTSNRGESDGPTTARTRSCHPRSP